MGLLKQTWAAMVVLSCGSAAIAGSCLPSAPLSMPTNADELPAYADLLRRDAETCFADVERYFYCLDLEKHEGFKQAPAGSESCARNPDIWSGGGAHETASLQPSI